MNWTSLWNRLAGHPSREEAEFDEEVAFHADMKARELAASGMDAESARTAARRAIGNVTIAREDVREAWSFAWLADARQDLRYAARGLATQPGFAVAAVLALVLGIGVNAILFNVYNGLALAPYAVPDAHRTVEVLGERGRNMKSWGGFTWPEYRYFRQHSETLAGIVGSTGVALRIARKPGEREWTGPAQAVSDNFFDVVGTGFTHGRGFSADAGRPRDPSPEIVLHHDTWVARFGSDAGIVGQWLQVNGHQLQVVGVAAAGFSGPEPLSPAAWIPAPWRDIFEPGQQYYDTVNSCCTSVVARLRPGVTRERVTAELTSLSAQFRKSVGQDAGRVRLTSLTLLSRPKVQSAANALFLALGVTALLILLLACANVANLQLARALARRREISVRLALGAGRGRVLRQMLAESLLLAAVAGSASIAIAGWAPSRVVNLLADESRITIRFDNDYRVLAFIAAVTLLAALISGLAPAWGAVREALSHGLREGSSATSGRRMRGFLLAAQVALSAVLVSGAMLMVRVAGHARDVDPGFTHANVIHMELGLGSSGATDEQSRAMIGGLIDRVAALPGVESVAHSLAAPFGNSTMGWGGMKDPRGGEFTMSMDRVSSTFHQTLRMPLRAGAGFTARDDARSGDGEIAVINQAAAERLFPGESPLGKSLPGTKIVVAGVTGAVISRQIGSETVPHMWIAAPPTCGSKLLIRHAPEAREALLSTLPSLARQQDARFFSSAEPYGAMVTRALRSADVAAAIAGVLGSLSLLLACVGIYGVAAYNVSQRTREIGIRMALGARPAGILATVLGRNLRTAGAGVAVGVVGAAGFGQLLKSLLYGVSPTDPAALAGSLAILVTTAVLAAWAPARRASTIDPAITLRQD